MKKVFVFLIVILVLLGIGWTVYLKERNRRFVESLPKPLDSAREDSSPPVPVVSEKTEQGFDPEFSTEIPDQRDVSKPHSESGATAQIPLEPKTLQPERHSHEKHPEPELQEEMSQKHQDISEMSPEEFAQLLADQFRGKTKGKHLEEIKTFERFFPKIMSRDEHLSIEDQYEFQKALTRLNPTAQNREGLRVMEERLKRHRDYPPGTQTPSEHVSVPRRTNP